MECGPVPREFISVADAAKELGITEDTIRHYIRTGRLKAYLAGNKYRIKREDWEKFLEKLQTTQGEGEEPKD
jgi:excisionase family DNA binding protein